MLHEIEMFQISNFFEACYNAVPLMESHCSMLQKILFTPMGPCLSHAHVKILGLKKLNDFLLDVYIILIC